MLQSLQSNDSSSIAKDRYQQIMQILLPHYSTQNQGNETLAQDAFVNDRDYFFAVWDKDVCNRLMKLWWVLPEPQTQRAKMGLVNLALEIFLEENPSSTESETNAYAISLLVERPTLFTANFLEKLRLYKLRHNLSWVELDRISQFRNHPHELLKMVLSNNNHPYPANSFITEPQVKMMETANPFPHTVFWRTPVELNITKFPSESLRSLDEAALLWSYLQNNNSFTEIVKEIDPTSRIRNLYFPRLAEAYKKQTVADQLVELFSAKHENSTDIFFDGLAFHNAKGKTFDDLMQLPKVKSLLRKLPLGYRYTFMKTALEERMGESSRYSIGQIWHSLESCLLKLVPIQSNHTILAGLKKPQLLSHFEKIANEWEEKNNYLPRILLATHLAHSNGLIITGETWQNRTSILLDYLKDELSKILASEDEFHAPQSPLTSQPPGEHSPAWLYWVPVAGSIATIRDGIEDKDWKELLLGGVLLSLDAWGLSELARPIARGVISLVSAGEKLVANSLRTLKETLYLPGEIALEELKIRPNSYSGINVLTEIPQGYEETFEAVRQGAQDQFWRDSEGTEYPLIYLTGEDRVVAVKSQGGSYQQIDWSGKKLLNKPLIYRDKSSGKYAVMSLSGGSNEYLLTALSKEEIEESYTVKEVKQIVSDLIDYLPFDPENKSYLADRFIVEGAEDFDVLAVYEKAYQKSPIFRAAFNRFVSHKEKWRIVIRENPVGSHTSSVTKTIILNKTPLVESVAINPKRYLGSDYVHALTYQGVHPEMRRAALHEFLHASLDVDDLYLAKGQIKNDLIRELNLDPELSTLSISEIKEKAVLDKTLDPFIGKYEQGIKKIAQEEQGGIVWLTEKIDSQISSEIEAIPHRLRYGSYSREEAVDITRLVSRVTAINQYLDKLFDQSTILKIEYLWGEKLENREIVQKMETFWRGIEVVSPLTSFSERFTALFSTQESSVAVFFEELYQKSKAFKKVFNYYSQSPASLEEKWGMFSLKITDPSILPTMTRDGRNVIYFLNDGTQYLSSLGLKTIEKERWFLYRVLEKLTGLSAFKVTEEIDSMAIREESRLLRLVNQREEIHQLVNQIFQEAKLDYPTCLSAVFLKPGDEQLRQIMLRQQISLTRVVKAEDSRLGQLLYSNTPSCLVPCMRPVSSGLKKSQLNHEPKFIETKVKHLNEISTNWVSSLSLIVGTIFTTAGALWIKRFRRSQNSGIPSGVVNTPLLPLNSVKSIPVATTVASQLLPTEAKKIEKKAILCRPKSKKSLHSFKDIDSNKAIRRKSYFFNSSLPNSVSTSPQTIPALCETYLPQLINNNQLQLASLFFTRSPRSKIKISSNLHQAEAVILAQELIASIRQSLETNFPEINRESVLGEVNLFKLQNQLAICFEMHNFSKIEENMSTAFKTLHQKLSPEDEKALKTNLTDLVNTFIDQAFIFSGRFQLSSTSCR